MNPAGQEECFHSNDIFAGEIPLWCQNSGKVNPAWLSICKEERNQTTNLLKQVTSFRNLQKAYKQVRRNGDSGGVDKMSVKDFGDWFGKHHKELQEEIQQESYEPQAVRGIQIPKPKGGFRQLGIPTIKDRVV